MVHRNQAMGSKDVLRTQLDISKVVANNSSSVSNLIKVCAGISAFPNSN